MVDYWWCKGSWRCQEQAQSGSGWGLLWLLAGVAGFVVLCLVGQWAMKRSEGSARSARRNARIWAEWEAKHEVMRRRLR